MLGDLDFHDHDRALILVVAVLVNCKRNVFLAASEANSYVGCSYVNTIGIVQVAAPPATATMAMTKPRPTP